MDFQDVKGKHPKFVTNEDYVGLFAQQRNKFPLYFPTGSQWRYTNFMLLALIVERVAKQSFATFLKREIFDPLGMKTAEVYERPSFSPREPAMGYHKDESTFEESWGTAPYRHESVLAVGFTPSEDLVGNFYAFNSTLRDGADVAVGDVLGNGQQDLILVPGDGGPNEVEILSGQQLVEEGAQAAIANPAALFAPTGLGPSGSGLRVAVAINGAGDQVNVVVGTGRNVPGLIKVALRHSWGSSSFGVSEPIQHSEAEFLEV